MQDMSHDSNDDSKSDPREFHARTHMEYIKDTRQGFGSVLGEPIYPPENLHCLKNNI